MSVECARENPASICVSGEIDLSNVDKLQSALNQMVAEVPKGFIVDMTGMTYIDSAGIQAILSAYKMLRKSDGLMVLVISNSAVKEIFDLLHLEMFPGIAIVDNIVTAKQMLFPH